MPNETEDYNNYVRANLSSGITYSADRYRVNQKSFVDYPDSKWYRDYITKFGFVSAIGGVEIGAAGTGLYSGYTLSWGDDFNALNIMTPASPRGRYFTTRTYLAGARGSDTLLGTMQDTDPFWTGHNDSNRGVAVGYDNMRINDSALEIQARRATAPEIAKFEGSGRLNVAGMISGAGAIVFYPSTQNTGDIILEWRQKWTAKAGNPAGWHPTLWMQSAAPTPAIDSDEVDFEGNSQGGYLHRSVWTAGSASVSSVAGVVDIYDNNYHTVTMILNTTQVLLYIDGVLTKTGAWSANTKAKPSSFLITNHLYNSGFEGENYSAAAWAADVDGATMTTDWVRVWRRTAQQHFAPLVAVPDANINFGGTVNIVIPSALSLWGDAGVTEYLQSVMTEENEPGASHTTPYIQFPAGVTYNAGTRTLTVAPSDIKAGRLNFVMMAYKTTGSTCEPLRFSVSVGPVVNLSDQNINTGAVVNIDAYALCDCGVLVSNSAGQRAKVVTVTGLDGSGLSYNDTTGLITGTAVEGSYSVTINTTNSLGQTASATKTFTVAVAGGYAYESWTGPGWFDADDNATLTLSGSNVTSFANKRSGAGNLTAGGTASGIQTVAGAQNGRDAIRVVRDVTSVTTVPRLTAGGASTLSTLGQGSDKPYTMIVAYKPTDTNTGYIAGWSDTVSVGESQQNALIRRSATAPSVRRQIVTATPLDVTWGSGQASGIPRIVAIKHTGTVIDVWDNSATTKSVSGAAQDANTFNAENTFHLFAAETGAASDPSFAQVQCNMDFYEILIEDTAKSDADIQQAISDLATKWAITLT